MNFFSKASIGILGGGQLGRMLLMAAADLGYKTVILDPDANCPSFHLSNHTLTASLEDRKALDELAALCCVVTYESENTPLDSIRYLSEKVPVYPSLYALEISQDRLLEKQFLQKIGLKTAPFFSIESEEQLSENLTYCGNSGILKTCRMGYDGKGQIRISKNNPISDLYAIFKGKPCILEGIVPFSKEISIIAFRSKDGIVGCYDPSENIHKNGILHQSKVPATIPTGIEKQAKEIAFTILNALEYVGVLGVELFVLENNTLVVNELAPRVHNSGHWTQAACSVSQFEQHIRIITGLPVGNPSRHSSCLMENLIGEDIKKAEQLLKEPNLQLRMYGKQEIRPGRKMGHYTKLFAFDA